MRQLTLALGPPSRLTFETFEAAGNAPLLAHLHTLGAGAPPVYAWGPPGCGKTHLLRALAHDWQSRGLQVGWYDAALRPPWQLPAHPALLLLDDAHAYDDAQQHAAFTLFIEAASLALPVVAAGAVPPVDLRLREDLRTRLGWGAVYAVAPLDDARAGAVLQREATRRGFTLADDVIAYLMVRHARDLGSLMRWLQKLDTYALSQHRAITIPLLRTLQSDPHAA